MSNAKEHWSHWGMLGETGDVLGLFRVNAEACSSTLTSGTTGYVSDGR